LGTGIDEVGNASDWTASGIVARITIGLTKGRKLGEIGGPDEGDWEYLDEEKDGQNGGGHFIWQ
jgi:hypothetical protein